MEIRKAEYKALETLVDEFQQFKNRELEAVIGIKGRVDSTEFFNIIKRLKAKNFVVKPQDDKLNILTPEEVRFSLVGLGLINQYCIDDSLFYIKDEVRSYKPFTAIIKDKSTSSEPLILDDYDLKIKIRREIPVGNEDEDVTSLLAKWDVQPKAFRLIRRWTIEDNERGIRYDLSMVRGTDVDRNGNYRWVRKFRDYDFLSKPPVYEVEVELLRKEDRTPEEGAKIFIAGIGDALRGYQKNTLLIRKSVKKAVLEEYKQFVKTGKFRGNCPRTLQIRNIKSEREPNTFNLRDGYNVTDKADGLRVMGYCNEDGELFLIDMAKNVYRTALQRDACAKTLVDGELITEDKNGNPIFQLLLFDIFYGLGGIRVEQLPFYYEEAGKEYNGRYGALMNWVKTWNDKDGPTIKSKAVTLKSMLQVSHKKFRFGKKGDDSIFGQAAAILDDSDHKYRVDGLIFTKNDQPMPTAPLVTFESQFKWKPAKENTIDFLVVMDKDPDSGQDKIEIKVHPKTGQSLQCKTMFLYVGSRRDPIFDDPKNTILTKTDVPESAANNSRGDLRTVLFSPPNYSYPLCAVSYVATEKDEETEERYAAIFDENNAVIEPITDRSIVEMFYDPAEEPGWRWKPLRVRVDKTERFHKAEDVANETRNSGLERTLNSEKTANDNWNSIYEPITLSMIRTGKDTPTETELEDLTEEKGVETDPSRKYYNRTAPKNDMLIVRGLQDFHNHWIKERILLQRALMGGNKTLLDLACGKGGDIQKWMRQDAKLVFGIDYASESILDKNDGAYSRLLNTILQYRPENVPPMVFAVGDCSKSITNGTAGATQEDSAIMQAIFNVQSPVQDPPKLVAENFMGALEGGADVVSCMFAIHYFFQNEEIFDGFLDNLRQTLKVGGYFIGCCFDGRAVFDLLSKISVNKQVVGKEGKGTSERILWSITKRYEQNDLPLDETAFGMKIDVNFISIGASHPEYLVPWELLVNKLKLIGCELLTEAERDSILLKKSTNMFSDSYDAAVKQNISYSMSESIKQFSFLNRWFIFKRKSDGTEQGAELMGALQKTVVTPTEGLTLETVLEATQPAAVTLEEAASKAPKGNSVAEALSAEVEQQEAPAKRFVASELVDAEKKKYPAKKVFKFKYDSDLSDKLKIGEPGAARWLSLSAPFPIYYPPKDKVTADMPQLQYPSIEHFLAAMKYTLASNKKDLGKQISKDTFTHDGTIHQKYLGILQERAGGPGKIPSDSVRQTVLAEERRAILDFAKSTTMKKYKVDFNEATWNSIKDGLLRYALEQRFAEDEKFQKIIAKVRDDKMYLLYDTPISNDEGGERKNDGSIVGQNKVGKLMMELAGYSPNP
jgi:hypothetical protein